MKKVEGITDFTVSLKAQKADIKFDPEKTDKKKIEEALKTTGYSIVEIPRTDEKKAQKKDEKKESGSE